MSAWSRRGFARALVSLSMLGVGSASAAGPAEFDGERALRHVAQMLEVGNRHYGAPGRTAAIDAIAAKLAKRVHRVEKQSFRARERVSGVVYPLTNLIGRRNPEATPRLLLGSHYDTRLWAEEDADSTRRESPITGANDGTSGVAVLLELLRVIEASPTLRDLGIDVVFFDGEEFGRPGNHDYCLGSIHFVRQLMGTAPRAAPSAVIVLDMVGDRDLSVRRERSSNAPLSRWLTDEIWQSGAVVAPGVFVDRLVGPIIDDQSPFQNRGIPAVLVIDFDYPHWHTHQDTMDKVSAKSLEQVGRTVADALPRIAATVLGAAEGPKPATGRTGQ